VTTRWAHTTTCSRTSPGARLTPRSCSHSTDLVLSAARAAARRDPCAVESAV
jgi:hypothetical protein